MLVLEIAAGSSALNDTSNSVSASPRSTATRDDDDIDALHCSASQTALQHCVLHSTTLLYPVGNLWIYRPRLSSPILIVAPRIVLMQTGVINCISKQEFAVLYIHMQRCRLQASVTAQMFLLTCRPHMT